MIMGSGSVDGAGRASYTVPLEERRMELDSMIIPDDHTSTP